MLQVTFNEADRILLDMADCAEQADHYIQEDWGSGCGTPACMLGTYGWQNPKSTAAIYLRKQIAYLAREDAGCWSSSLAYPHEEFKRLCDELQINDSEFDRLFEAEGCGDAKTDGKKAAEFVREFVRERALARIET